MSFVRWSSVAVVFFIVNNLFASENFFYRFDYHASIVKNYKPSIDLLEARYAYRQEITRRAQIADELLLKTRRNPSVELVQQTFESLLKTVAFVDGNYQFQFKWDNNVGAPYASFTYIELMGKLMIPKHILCEIQLYRIAYYVNTHRPELAYDSSYSLTYKDIKRYMDIYACYTQELSGKYPHMIERLYEFQLYFKNYSIMNETEVSNKIHRYYQYTEDNTFKTVYKAWQISQDPVKREQLLFAASTNSPVVDFPEETGSVYGNGYIINYIPPACKQIQDSLKYNEASVEMIAYAHYNLDSFNTIRRVFTYQTPGIKSYAAILVDKTNISLLSINEAFVLEGKQYKYYYNAIKFQKSDTLSYSKYWKTIDSVLLARHVTKIYFCPDGVYNVINLNTLKTSKGEYVLDHYAIHNIINTRSLLSVERHPDVKHQSYLIGYPNYNQGLDKKKKKSKHALTNLQRSVEQQYSTGMVSPLPGTKEEIAQVKIYFDTYHVSNKVLDLNEANEKNVFAINNPYILHIASHGFFYSEIKDSVYKDPLLRSGIFLSGCNSSIMNQCYPNADSLLNDGVLYAKEVTHLPLYYTKLVVLSACETGLGEIHEGDGVVGFQRAFGVAGVEYMLMSLWKVDDVATKDFMIALYQHMFERNSTVEEAYRAAVETIKIKYLDPYYWGAFKLIKN